MKFLLDTFNKTPCTRLTTATFCYCSTC